MECDKKEWGRWLASVLTDRLAGTGLRPEVEYLPAVVEERRDRPGAEPVRKETTPERYRLTVVCPLEWKVTNYLQGDDIGLPGAGRIVDAVLEFHDEAWPERISTDWMYDLWKRVPGFFEWITEQAPSILYRVTMAQLTRRFGPRCVKGITMYEDLLVVHARWAGDFYIGIDNYRDRLEEVASAMRAFMRKPIRHQYLYQLRHGSKDKKQD